MASAAEQLAANLNWGAFAKASELKKRVWFTLGALLVYRLGTYLPLPGISPAAFAQAFNNAQTGIFGLFNMFSGGAVGRHAIFVLGIMPYISASIIVQLLTTVLPSFEALKKEGEAGRKQLNQYTRFLTVILAVVQAYGIAAGLESATGVVSSPGLFFRVSTVLTLLGGTMFMMWLGEQITSRGIGNGTSLIIFSGIVANLPHALASLLELGRTGALSPVFIVSFIVIAAAVIALVVFVERAQRRVIVQYPKRQVGQRMFGGESSHMPLKVNTAGVIPPIFASSILLIPATISGFANPTGEIGWLQYIANALAHGQPLYMATYAFMIIFFSYFYTAVVFNPEETADNLKKYGGFIPGIRPGANTAAYFDHVLTRLTTIGGVYMCVVCLMPEILISRYGVPFYFGGTSLMIIVSVTMDTVTQIQSHLLAHQYEGMIKKSRTKGRGR